MADMFGLNRAEQRELARRFLRGRLRTFPAATQLYTVLEQFHHAEEGVAVIPAPLSMLTAIHSLKTQLHAWLRAHLP